MLRLEVVVFLFLFAGSQYAAAVQVRAAKSSINNNEIKEWLVAHIVPTTWLDAAAHCQLEGGVLASPTTRDIVQAMLRVMAIDPKLSSGGVFIGVNNVHTGGSHFVTLDGAPFADIPLDWAAGEPNNAGNSEKCLAITGKNELADVSCASLLPFFCLMQSAHDPSTPIKLCKGKEGYKWEHLTGSCYKFHTTATTWNLARKICKAEGAYLAIINSVTESTLLSGIFTKHQDKITGSQHTNYAFVGFTKLGDDKWITLQGQSLSEAGFEQWAKGEPNNSGGHERCGSMILGGQFNDCTCDEIFAFICEMES